MSRQTRRRSPRMLQAVLVAELVPRYRLLLSSRECSQAQQTLVTQCYQQQQ